MHTGSMWCHSTVGGINYDLNGNHTKYLTELCGRLFNVLENFHRKFTNLVAQSTDGTMKRLVRCKDL